MDIDYFEDMDEEMESYYEGKADGATMFTDVQHKQVDDMLDLIKKGLMEKLLDDTKYDLKRKINEVKDFNDYKKKTEEALSKERSCLDSKNHELVTREREIEYKEREIKEIKKEITENREHWETKYGKAIEGYTRDTKVILKGLLEKPLVAALKSFTFPTFYTYNRRYGPVEKCDLCDENRKRSFTDDKGKKYKIDCPCTKYYATTPSIEKVKVIFELGIIPESLEDGESLDETFEKLLLITVDRYCSDMPYSTFLERCFNPNKETAKEYEERRTNQALFVCAEDAEIAIKYVQEKEKKNIEKSFVNLNLEKLLVPEED